MINLNSFDLEIHKNKILLEKKKNLDNEWHRSEFFIISFSISMAALN